MFGRTEPWEVWGPSSEQPELGLNASIAGLRQVTIRTCLPACYLLHHVTPSQPVVGKLDRSKAGLACSSAVSPEQLCQHSLLHGMSAPTKLLTSSGWAMTGSKWSADI